MSRNAASFAKFAFAFILMTIVLSMMWSAFVTDRLYNCTDAVGFDYFTPGSWVHGEVMVVEKVVDGRSMSEPDTIKAGWSLAGLGSLWVCFLAVSLITSIVFARWTRVPVGAPNKRMESNG